MEVAGFLVFSTIESLALFAIMLAMFRYRLTEFSLYYVVLSFLLSLLSYSLRVELNVTALVPVAAVLLFSLALFVRLEMSLVSSFIVSIAGYLVFGAVQTLVLYGLESAGVLRLELVQGNTPDSYVLQAVSSALLFAVSYLLYVKGYGFIFPLSLFRLRGENVFVLALLLLSIGFLAGVTFLAEEVYIAALAFVLSLLLLMTVLIRKERRYVGSLIRPNRGADEAGDPRASGQ